MYRNRSKSISEDLIEPLETEDNDPKNIQKNSSIATVSALLNQMLGGTMLVLPILFSKAGIIGGILNMGASAIISCKTCLIYNEHFKTKKETDYQQSVRRILGPKFELVFRIAKLAYLFLVLIVFFDLITIQLYQFVVFIIATSTDNGEDYYVPTDQDNQFIWNKFSIPYATILNFFICLALVFQKNLVFIIKIASYGAITIIAFCIFIIYIFFANVFTSNFKDNIKDQTLISADIGTLAGTSAMAFQVHLNACASLRCNKVQTNNKRDLMWVYFFGALIYIIIGVLGSLAIVGNCVAEPDDQATINDCFKATDVANVVIIVIYLFNLITSFPIYYNIMKDAFFDLAMKGRTPSQKILYIFGVCYLLLCCVVQNIPKVSPDQLMSLNGSVCCFFFIYMIPILMHIRCYHGENKLMNMAKRSLSTAGVFRKRTEHDALVSNAADEYPQDIQKVNMASEGSFDPTFSMKESVIATNKNNKQETFSSFESCNFHAEDVTDSKWLTLRIILYSLIGLVGLTLLFYELYLVVASFT